MGLRLSQVKFKADGTSEDSYYGYNPHSVETITSQAGDTRSTYGYTAYGKNDDDRFTGVDKPEAQNPGKEPYNVYRFNAKRRDQSSAMCDMGFRDGESAGSEARLPGWWWAVLWSDARRRGCRRRPPVHLGGRSGDVRQATEPSDVPREHAV
ncbi:hypothetical protein [Kribbella sp. VKM Ac-2571]|uniref:hypothetical protein n=1 Tax=Kribbella sp. VKM Ac-2571 TaxID=2512222 RepID=UPI00105D208D|nr:hypothetical protein [Kribbella sp. VKM Ac-2571]